MISEYLFDNDFPEHAKSIYCNGRTYTREEFLREKERFLKRKTKRRVGV